MNPATKRTILPYIASTILILLLVIVFSCRQNGSSDKRSHFETIQNSIVERERMDLPLIIQEFDKVYNITIDSMVITNQIKPYSGYLVTKWDIGIKQETYSYQDRYIRRRKTVYVPVTDIIVKRKTISWSIKWDYAYTQTKYDK